MKLKSKSNGGSMFVKFEKIGDSCEGTFVEWNKDVPSRFGNENNLILRGKSGPLMVRCGTKLTSIIDDNLESFIPGSLVRIKYIGDVPTTKGNPMKDFDVDVDPPTKAALDELASEGNRPSDADESVSTADDAPF